MTIRLKTENHELINSHCECMTKEISYTRIHTEMISNFKNNFPEVHILSKLIIIAINNIGH